MADPLISISYSDRQVSQALGDLLGRLKDPTPQLKAARETILFYIDQGFEKETDPQGIPWKPNSRYTRSLKRAQGRIDKVLQSTGRLRASINGQIVGDRLIVGTNVQYGAKHQLGLEGLPQRKFLGISDEAKKEILAEFTAITITGKTK